MNAAGIAEIRKELSGMRHTDLVALCTRLARFKKENKELLNYVLFESGDEASFAGKVKQEISEIFEGINFRQIYYAKKTLRKILRLISKYARYSSEATTETELRIHFCLLLRQSPLKIEKDKGLLKIYESQFAKIGTLLGQMHEDLQYDYLKQMKLLE